VISLTRGSILLLYLLAQAGTLVHSAELPPDCVECIASGPALQCADEDCGDGSHHHHGHAHAPGTCRTCGDAAVAVVDSSSILLEPVSSTPALHAPALPQGADVLRHRPIRAPPAR
jgi:hypothetical protein